MDGPEDIRMSSLMLAAVLALGQTPQPAHANPQGAAPGQQAASTIDGTWTVLFCEKDGQKISTSQNNTVTIQNNVLTWNKDGKEHRVHLMLGANHMLTAWPENMQQGAQQQAKPGEAAGQKQVQTPAKPGQPAGKQPNTATAQAERPAAKPEAVHGGPGTQLPLPAQGQTPAQPARAATAENTPAQGSHHGVYIDGGDVLCLSLDKAFMEEKTEHAAVAPKPATQSATPVAGRQAQAPTTGGTANSAVPNQQAGAKPGTPATNQSVGAQASQQGQNIRQAAYGPGSMEHSGFVLILERENAGQQQRR